MIFQSLLSQDIYIGISTYGKQVLDIAILPFFSSEELSDAASELREIIKADLNYSLYFSILEDHELPQISGFLSPNWKNIFSIGAEAIIVGNLKVYETNYVLDYIIVDPLSKSTLAENSISYSPSEFRYIAHSLSDEIVSMVAGENGIFMSKILYVRKGANTSIIRLCDYDGFNDFVVIGNNNLNLSPFWGKDGQIYFTTYYYDHPDIVSFSGHSYNIISNDGNLNIGGEISPDGSKLAFTKNKDRNTDIYILNLSTKIAKKITVSSAIDCSPAWSPSGTQLAFTSDRSGTPQIYIVSSEGTGLRAITNNGNYNSSPAWSPRGDRIAFVGQVGSNFQIFIIDVSGSNLKQLTTIGNNENPTWSADGLHIVFSSNRTGSNKIYTMNFNGTSVREIISSPGSVSPNWQNNFETN